MNSNRVFLALTAGLLTVADNRLAAALDKAAQFCRLDAGEGDAAPNAVVRNGFEPNVSLLQWIEARRAEHVVSLVVITCPECDHAEDDDEEGSEAEGDTDDEEDEEDEDDENDEDDDGRPPHMMAGFAGGLPMLLSLKTDRGHFLHAQGTATGPRLLLTAPLFVRLLARQTCPDFYWPIVLSEINQFHRCNGMDEIAPASLQSHFSSQAGEHDWEVMGDQIFREIQVEALTFDEPFSIPSEFAQLVKAVTPFFEHLEPMIWLEIIDEDVSGAQLLRLIEVQGFSARIWQITGDQGRLRESLDEEEYDLDEFPNIAACNWPDYLAGLSADEAWPICHELVELVRIECQRSGTQPVIPHDLKHVFGPDDEERRRLHYRGRLQHDLGWRMCKVDRPRMSYVLDRIEGAVPIDATPPLGRSRQDFIAALCATRDFARRVESPFVDTFEFALHLAAHAEGDDVPDLAALRRNDSGRPLVTWQSVDRFIDKFGAFGWGASRVLGLAAISAADIFGGMGSWNDQGFDGDDEAEFHAVSEQLFGAMNRYYDALVSFET